MGEVIEIEQSIPLQSPVGVEEGWRMVAKEQLIPLQWLTLIMVHNVRGSDHLLITLIVT